MYSIRIQNIEAETQLLLKDIKKLLSRKNRSVIALPEKAKAYRFVYDYEDVVEETPIMFVGYDKSEDNLMIFTGDPCSDMEHACAAADDGWKSWEIVDAGFYGLLTSTLINIWNSLDLLEKQLALQDVEPVYFDPNTYADQRDIPQIRDLDVVGVAFNKDGTIECGTECDGILFHFRDEDLTNDEKIFLIQEAYAYRFGEDEHR